MKKGDMTISVIRADWGMTLSEDRKGLPEIYRWCKLILGLGEVFITDNSHAREVKRLEKGQGEGNHDENGGRSY